ncbi:Acetyltransferase (GNAT) domain-containing protein [Pseudomonas sp. NFACC02]|uniref:GNAT family N-acyltransferase n=1 Tax=Pseudomonas sp. NFACC02 TaxID=1566250 RepID=UPI0008D812B0|nr:GNAT family N-acyltransferase [Pseudomonas sp. NFACC02]SER51329.1 Acetyltransferase (GNAT) domain-containing protein [Pseudomonas sp. NFACC02]
MTTSTLPLDFPVPTRRTNQVYIASTEPDLAKVQTIWEEVYKEELGWLDETNTDPRNDRFHASSVYLLATGSEGEPVGVMRMVIDSAQGLPVENFIDITPLREAAQGSLVECARLMVPARYRDQKFTAYPHGVFAALVKAALHHCLKEKNYNVLANCFLDTRTTPIKALVQMGFKDLNIRFRDELKEASECTVLHLDIKDMLSIFYGQENGLGNYIMMRNAG